MSLRSVRSIPRLAFHELVLLCDQFIGTVPRTVEKRQAHDSAGQSALPLKARARNSHRTWGRAGRSDHKAQEVLPRGEASLFSTCSAKS